MFASLFLYLAFERQIYDAEIPCLDTDDKCETPYEFKDDTLVQPEFPSEELEDNLESLEVEYDYS